MKMGSLMKRPATRCVIAFSWLMITTGSSRGEVPAPIEEILSSHCGDCHIGTYPEGDFSLGLDLVDFRSADTRGIWREVHDLVRRRIMPPVDMQPLSDDDHAMVLSWISGQLIRHGQIGGGGVRRLSRREYESTIEDIFGLSNFEVADSFPPPVSNGRFDNQLSELGLSGTHMEAFAATATKVADSLFPPQRPPVPRSVRLIPADDLVITYSSAMRVDQVMRLASTGSLRRNGTWPAKFEAPARGTYRLRITASAGGASDETTPNLMLSRGKATAFQFSDVRTFELLHGVAKTFTFETELDRGETIAFQYSNAPLRYEDQDLLIDYLRDLFTSQPELAAAWDRVGDPARGGSGWDQVLAITTSPELTPPLDPGAYSEGSSKLDQLIKRMAKDKVAVGETIVYRAFDVGPWIGIHELEIDGPLDQLPERDDLKAQRLARAFLGTDFDRGSSENVGQWMTQFVSSVFRRPARPAEVEAFVDIFDAEWASSKSTDQAMHLVIRSILMSPSFLFRGLGEDANASEDGHQLNGPDLATRLAFFLTSRPPDEALLTAAADGELSTSKGLRRHAARLLDNGEHREAFIRDFVGQWLQLGAIDRLMPDPKLLARFTADHRKGMKEEAYSAMRECLEEDLAITHLIAPDHLWTNRAVAGDIYELASKDSDGKRGSNAKITRWEVPTDGPQGGLLGMAGVMMTTANGVDTQPVLRGVWVLNNILGTPPPEPPDAVPALTPDTSGSQSPKDRLAAHMSDSSCAACHREIDPIGFALENFDAIGRWRDRYEPSGKSRKGSKGLMVDASGQMPDGTRIHDVIDLKRWLAERPHILATCLGEKWMTYATGRTLTFREREMISRIAVRHQTEHDLALRTYLLDLTGSTIMRNK
ncbi:MAG: DUF1588 domain-containing protein [Planctomycetota bacterium]